jgi:hypothetical protein
MEATTNQAWQRSVSGLISRLCTDGHNAQLLGDPWSRAAHCMVQGWRIRMSRPPAKGDSPMAPRRTWRDFARRGVGILASKRHRANKSDWERWAMNRTIAGSRYIPKARRQW